MKKTLLPLLACILWMAAPATAQDYGTGETLVVPRVAPGSLTMDGVADEPAWDLGATVDVLRYANFFTDEIPEPDLTADARLLYSSDTLYVYVRLFDNAFFVSADEPFESDQILVGIDPLHEAGVTDTLTADFDGWPENAPDEGPYTYKVWQEGITLNWGFDGIFPVDSMWVNGAIFIDEENLEWGVEMAIYVPGLEPGAEIGFNLGGAQASEAVGFAYGWYSWQVVDPENPGTAGGDVMAAASSFATLRMAGGGEGYGSGVVIDVPRVDPGTLTMDGTADEPAWDGATEIDMMQYVNFFLDEIPEPDLITESKLLYTEDTLYVYVRVFDNAFFASSEEPFESDQILVGIDGTHAGDDQQTGFDGWPQNAPDKGPTTYKVWMGDDEIPPFTLNWNSPFAIVGDDTLAVQPADSGWVNGTVFMDEQTLEWGMEAAFYVPQAEGGAQIGFNLGGAQASDAVGFAYGWYSWQVADSENPGTAGGDVMADASSFATLNLVTSTAIEETPLGEVPDRFELDQNYPNPFNPATTIEYGLKQAGRVTLSVYNTLGQRVATLVDGQRAAGTYQVRWDVVNLPSGVYLYQLSVDGAVAASRTMTLLK